MEQRIDPERIGAPFQFLAAALVFIVLLDGSFLSAAAVIERPAWAAGLLVVAAVVNVPLLLVGMFVLQTRFRVELLGDQQYVELQKIVEQRTQALKRSNDAAGIDLYPGFTLEAQQNVSAAYRTSVSRDDKELQEALEEHGTILGTLTVASAARELGRAAAANGDWASAAGYFQTTADANPADWAAWFALATALANVRGAPDVDARALDAMVRAIELAPASLERSLALRMRSYKAALLKRLSQRDDALRDEALGELLALQGEAVAGTYEAEDIAYNLACLYAMSGNESKAVEQLGKIQDDRFLLGAASHRRDYFAGLVGYAPFEDLIAGAVARMQAADEA